MRADEARIVRLRKSRYARKDLCELSRRHHNLGQLEAIMVNTLSPNMQSNALSDLDGLPFDADTMFADHNGVYKPRIEKKQRKLARKLPFLKEFLEDDEKLLVITTAVSPTSFIEQWTTGLVFVYIKRCLLVMTNKRIFHIPTTLSFDYRRSIAQIRYGDIDSIAQKGSKLKIRYKSGAKDLFYYVRRAERKKIRVQLPLLSREGPSSKVGKRAHLCPRCSAELENDNFECPGCGLEFKSRKKSIDAFGLDSWWRLLLYRPSAAWNS